MIHPQAKNCFDLKKYERRFSVRMRVHAHGSARKIEKSMNIYFRAHPCALKRKSIAEP